MKVCVKNKVLQYVRPFCCDYMRRLWDQGCVTYLAIENKVIIVPKINWVIDDPQIHFCPFCGEAIQIKEMVSSIENKIENDDSLQDLPWSWAY